MMWILYVALGLVAAYLIFRLVTRKQPAITEAPRQASEPTRPEPVAPPSEAAPVARQPPAPGVQEPARPEPTRPAATAEPTPAPVEPSRAPEAPAAPRTEAPVARGGVREAEVAALRQGLSTTRGGLIARLGQLFKGKKELDPALVDEIEEVLLTSDVGVKTTQKLMAALHDKLGKSEIGDTKVVWSTLRQEATRILDLPSVVHANASPHVIMVVGVNGVGKTTTIGKLASRISAEGKKVVLAAGDTFRAAAVQQLEIWGKRTGCEVVTGKEGADPSSVIFDAVKAAKERGADVVIADTAGRLHTKTNLMEELKKVKRVIAKAQEGAPHEVLLVLDATNGQNAIAQVQLFREALEINGIVLTKLDGTAKGGVILGICDEHRIPVRFVGIGERVEDLRDFRAGEFVEALFFQAEDESIAA
jgi:fused signal recognition particle receptor